MTLRTPLLARRHPGVVQLALSVVLVAAATVATVTVLQAAQSMDAPGSETVAPVQAAPASGTVLDTPVRDQWYLDSVHAPASGARQTYEPPVRDQWYLDH